jgi:hypothetical protein
MENRNRFLGKHGKPEAATKKYEKAGDFVSPAFGKEVPSMLTDTQ